MSKQIDCHLAAKSKTLTPKPFLTGTPPQGLSTMWLPPSVRTVKSPSNWPHLARTHLASRTQQNQSVTANSAWLPTKGTVAALWRGMMREAAQRAQAPATNPLKNLRLSFENASQALEKSYVELQDRVRILSEDLEKKRGQRIRLERLGEMAMEARTKFETRWRASN